MSEAFIPVFDLPGSDRLTEPVDIISKLLDHVIRYSVESSTFNKKLQLSFGELFKKYNHDPDTLADALESKFTNVIHNELGYSEYTVSVSVEDSGSGRNALLINVLDPTGTPILQRKWLNNHVKEK